MRGRAVQEKVEELLLKRKVSASDRRKFHKLFEAVKYEYDSASCTGTVSAVPDKQFTLKRAKREFARTINLVTKEDIVFKHPTNGVTATLRKGTRIALRLVPKYSYGNKGKRTFLYYEVTRVNCNSFQDCVMTYNRKTCFYEHPNFPTLASAALGTLGIVLQRAASLDYKDRKGFASLESANYYYHQRGITLQREGEEL